MSQKALNFIAENVRCNSKENMKNYLIIFLGTLILFSCQETGQKEIEKTNKYLEFNLEHLEEVIKLKNVKNTEKYGPFFNQFVLYMNESDSIKTLVRAVSNATVKSIDFKYYVNKVKSISQFSSIKNDEGDSYSIGIDSLFENSHKESKEIILNKILSIDILIANRILRELDYRDIRFDIIAPTIDFIKSSKDSIEWKISVNPHRFVRADYLVLGTLDENDEIENPTDTIMLDQNNFHFKVSSNENEGQSIEGVYVYLNDKGSYKFPIKFKP